MNEKRKMKRYLLATVINSNTNNDYIEISKEDLYFYFKDLIKNKEFGFETLDKFIQDFNIKFIITRYSMRWILDVKLSPDTDNYIYMKKPWEYKIGDKMPIVINLKSFGCTKDIYGFFIPVEKE